MRHIGKGEQEFHATPRVPLNFYIFTQLQDATNSKTKLFGCIQTLRLWFLFTFWVTILCTILVYSSIEAHTLGGSAPQTPRYQSASGLCKYSQKGCLFQEKKRSPRQCNTPPGRNVGNKIVIWGNTKTRQGNRRPWRNAFIRMCTHMYLYASICMHIASLLHKIV